MSIWDWSTTAASNDVADVGAGINFSENQLPGSLNDSMRGVMMQVKKLLNSIGGTVSTTGASNVYALTEPTGIAALTTGQFVGFKANFTNTSTATLNVNGLGAKPIYADGAALGGGEIKTNGTYVATYDSTIGSGVWKLVGLKSFAKTGGFYANHNALDGSRQNANVVRGPDRLFVGDAANYDGAYPATNTGTSTGQNWSEYYRNATQLNAQFAAMTTDGLVAILGAARTAQQPTAGSMSAHAGLFHAFNDNATNVQYCYSLVAEARRYSGAGTTQASEFGIGNFGSVVASGPYNPFVSGATMAGWFASGVGAPGNGDVSSPNDASVGIGIVNNNAKFGIGLLFGKTAISGTDGTTGSGTAIAMAKGHCIEWWRDSGGIGSKAAYIGSTVSGASNNMSLVFSNSGLLVQDVGNTTTYMQIAPGGVSFPQSTVGLELGASATSNQPYIDMHSSASATDYDVRLQASGGTASDGAGLLTVFAGGMRVAAPIYIAPGASVTPGNNGDVAFELTNNTTLKIKAKGSDGTVRSVTLTLA